MTASEMVRDFERAFGGGSPDAPTARDRDVRDLRIRLVKEEFLELVDALYGGDLCEIAKEAADLLYVVHGTALAYGLDLDAAVREVHRSNMSKLGPGGEVIRRDDGKVIKGPGYRPADMESVVFGVTA